MIERIGDGGVYHFEDDPPAQPDTVDTECHTMESIYWSDVSTDMEVQVGWLTHKCENLEERLETA